MQPCIQSANINKLGALFTVAMDPGDQDDSRCFLTGHVSTSESASSPPSPHPHPTSSWAAEKICDVEFGDRYDSIRKGGVSEWTGIVQTASEGELGP